MQASHVTATARVVALVSTGMVPLAFADPPPVTSTAPAPGPAVEVPDVTQTRIAPAAPAPAATAPAPATPAAAAPAATTPAGAVTPSAPAARTPGADENQFERHLLAEGYVVRMKDGERLFCKRDVSLGTRLMSAFQCATKEAIQARETQDKREAEDAQQRARTGYGQLCTGPNGRQTTC